MAKYTVVMLQAHVTYQRAEVEVEAPDEDIAYKVAALMDLEWTSDEAYSEPGHRDIEVTSESGGSVSWRED